MTKVALQWQDVRLEDNIVWIHIRCSKTDQHGRGADLILATCSIVELCPVGVVGTYLGIRMQGQ